MNSNITVGDKPLLWEECVKNGLIFVNDLFFWHQLEFNQLISANPKTWKIKLQNGKKNK